MAMLIGACIGIVLTVLVLSGTRNGKIKAGYRMGEYNGVTWRGHEFHYSSLRNPMESACQLYSARNTTVDTALIRYKNVIAGYTHLYWGEQCIFDLWK